MLLWVCFFISVFTAQSNLEAMTMTGGGKSGGEETKGAVAGKYTYELCNIHTASVEDIQRIMELAREKDKVKTDVRAAKAEAKDEATDGDEIEERSDIVSIVSEGFFNKLLDIRTAYTMLHCGILVARSGKNIVGFLVFADKKLSEQCGAVPTDTKKRAREYCMIGEICIDKIHQDNELDRLLGQFFVRECAPRLIPQPEIVLAEDGCEEAETSGGMRHNPRPPLHQQLAKEYNKLYESWHTSSGGDGRLTNPNNPGGSVYRDRCC